MKISLQIDVTGPDDELRSVGQTYAAVRREIELPYPPYPSLSIGLTGKRVDDDERIGELLKSVKPSGLIEVHSVTFREDRQATYAYGYVGSDSQEQFYNTVERFVRYYGFEVSG
jgi:hypothetical protein